MKTNVFKKLCRRLLPALFPSFCFAQMAYVDINAVGANNGSSWANAYTDLSAALAQSAADTLWIAQGVYKPGSGGTDVNAFFSVSRPMVLLGGFAGAETSPDQRQPGLYPTVLSGDLLGNDTDGNFLIHKTDNSRLIMRVQADVHTRPTLLDGLTVAYGYKPQTIPGLQYPSGLWASSRVNIQNCSFRQNLADGGAAIGISGLATAYSEISHCSFEGNRGNFLGIVSITGSEHIALSNLSMSYNDALNGMLYLAGVFDATLEDSDFSNNTNGGQGGGGLYLSSVAPIVIKRCRFTQNQGRDGGAVVLDYQNTTDPGNIRFEDCIFEENTARFLSIPGIGRGGAFYAKKGGFELRRCLFTGNQADEEAGAIFFDGNHFRIDSCWFESNASAEGGALLLAKSGSTAQISNSSFVENTALRHGGAISLRPESNLDLSRCTFFRNTADSLGGAIRVFSSVMLAADSCTFEANEAQKGGAISAVGTGETAGGMGISRTRFRANQAVQDGGALYVQDVGAYLTNCLLFSNVAFTGGGVATSHQTPLGEVALVNCTLADNEVGISSSAVQGAQPVLFMLNTVLDNFGPNYQANGGSQPQWSSLGGNFITDNSLAGFNQPGDQTGMALAPLFINTGIGDYRPAPGSPLINGGLPGNAPADDITGQLRDGAPDIGAYEAILTSVGEPMAMPLPGLYPNPARGHVWLQLPPDWTGQPVTIILYDPKGRHIRQEATGTPEWKFALPQWPAGSYVVVARCGHQRRMGVVLML